MLAALAKVCSEDSVSFKLVNERCISSSVADKNLTNLELDIEVPIKVINDPTRPGSQDTSSDSSL